MSKTRKNFFSWLLLLSFYPLFTQQLRFRHITTEEGLSTNFVRAILQDDKGFMWFGTQDGLNRYDGYTSKSFKHEPGDASTLSSSEITALLQVRPDLILVGTRKGLCLFNPLFEKCNMIAGSAKLLGSRVNALLLADSNTVLAGTDLGAYELRLSDRRVRPISFDAGVVNVRCIEKVDNNIYFGTLSKGLWRLSGNQAEKALLVIPDYIELGEEALQSVTHISQYAGKMYLGTHGYGILKVDRSLEIQSHISFANLHEHANVINDFILRNNKAYVASAHGVLVYNLISSEVNHYTKKESAFSLNANTANCILMDNQNNFWVGTDQGGVNIAFSRLLKFPLSTHGFEQKFTGVHAFLELDSNLLLLGGAATFHELNTATGQIKDGSSFLDKGTVLCVAPESRDILWAGTSTGDIYRYERSTGKAKRVYSSEPGNAINSLLIDGDHVYAGASPGLVKIHLRTFVSRRYTSVDGLPDVAVNSVYKDSRGNVWLATNDGGLVKMKGFGFGGRLPVERIYVSDGQKGHIASNIVFGLNEDNRKNIWVATSLGLSKLRADHTFRNYYQKDGLANTFIHAIRRDSVGSFWMSSNGGITHFNPLVAEDEVVFKNYGVKDGLLNSEYNRGAAHSAASGMMYFGGPKGFNAFRPSFIKDNLHPPPVFITGYKRAGLDVATDTMIAYKQHLTLNWPDNYFQVEVVALDFTDPQNNKFRYMLEGYDNTWSAPTGARYISYTELPGGQYTLRIKAANNDGIWNEAAAALHITVVPPFWKTTAFYFIIIISGIALVYAFTTYRTRSVKRENRLLEHKVALRTKELASKNKDITSSIQYAKRIQEALLPARDNIFRKLKKVFILYRPKDIVSGDFYWFAEKGDTKVFAVVDCTGHGVPGAFMSMIGHNLLHQVVTEKGITEPSEILNELHRGVQRALRQGNNEISTNDGMDVSLITINDAKREVRWAGANRPLVIIDANGGFTRYDGNKYPVGGTQIDADRIFTTHVISVTVASMAYLFTDGYADQFGGEKGKKFMVRRFHNLLMNVHKLPPEEQQQHLEKNFESWTDHHEQVDDVLIVGIEI